jgi:protein phosphatase PTC2/3
MMYGPLRIFPGRLSVSRAFGDIEAKRKKYGGNPLVLNAIPDIKQCKIEEQYDFILLGCDGIFDKLSDTQVLKAVWEAARKRYTSTDVSMHTLSGAAVETVLKLSVDHKTADNITVVVVCFKNMKK